MIDARKHLSDDGVALIMLCSHLGMGNGDEASASPLTLRESNALTRKINDSEIKHPSGLLGMSGPDLSKCLSIPATEADRIVQLLDRGGSIALELEQLSASGIWCVTRADDSYPARIRNTLKHQAPPVLFGAGDSTILDRPAIGIVGSRNIDEAGANFARRLGELSAQSSAAVVSGGARGTDRIAMQGALDAGGFSVGILADSLTRTIRQPDVRNFITDGRLILLTPYRPDNGFSIGAAMGRNKIIYGASDFSVVVSSELKKGGTWAGAVETLTAGWCPVFVRSGKDLGPGNEELIARGGRAFSAATLEEIDDVIGWMKQSFVRQPEQEVLSFA
jgi:predicted Rossmann fold nucleotide-binding protein DprA/Smf involved in DNA uptake